LTKRRLGTTNDTAAFATLSSVTTTPQLDKSNSKLVIEKEATKNFKELALRKFKQNDYSNAKTFLRKVVKRNQQRENGP
jgi:hypothetical protein